MGEAGPVYCETGEQAPTGGQYELVGHEIPASNRCASRRRKATIRLLEGGVLPYHEACGGRALWRLISMDPVPEPAHWLGERATHPTEREAR